MRQAIYLSKLNPSSEFFRDILYTLTNVNNRNNRKRCEIYSKLRIKTKEQRRWRRSDDFIVNLQCILHIFLVFLWLTINR